MKILPSSLGLGTLLRRLAGVRLGRLYQYPPKALSVRHHVHAEYDPHWPTFSVVTPSFNQGKFIGETLCSVRDQKYPGLQYVIQDACSNDETEEVLKSFGDAGFFIRIESDRGQADALNKGFSYTSADIMGYLNSDDLLLPGTLHFVAQYFYENPSVDVVYGNRLIIDERGCEVGRWILPEHDPHVMRFIDYIPQESMFWRRSVWENIGSKFDESLQFAMDWDLILRFVDSGAVFHHVPDLFGVFRVHGDQKTQTLFAGRGAEEVAVLRFRNREDGLNFFQRILRHGQYLYQHVKADLSWRKDV